MVMRAMDRKMWRDLWAFRAQTVTVALLIICGISFLVGMWSAYDSLKSARGDYYQRYAFADVFAEFTAAGAESLTELQRVPGVGVVVPRLVTTGLVHVENRAEPAVGRFISIPSGQQPVLNRLYLRSGRLPENGDETEIAVHEGFAKAHGLKPGGQITIIINGQSEKARITGIAISPEFVYALSPTAALPDDLHFGVFWLTQRQLRRMMKRGESFNSVVAKLTAENAGPGVVAAFDRILKPYGCLGAATRDQEVSDKFLQDEIAQQKVSAVFIPAIFLGIATFLVNIIAPRLISLHRPQIAALKAIGYTGAEVSVHYLKLILVIVSAGTLPGLVGGAALGSWISRLYQNLFRFPNLDFSISPTAAFVGLIAGVLPGLLGAATSIRSIFALAPAEAMRPLAPPAFHASLIERFQLKKFFAIRGLMSLRNLLLRPFRLLLIVLSLSAALAIVVAAGSWFDMIKFLVETQFQRMQREDLSINLVRPLPAGMLQEVAGLPGVVALEGFRVVPVRLKFRNHKRELALTGWPDHAQMRQLLNRKLEPTPLPTQGILLSRFFAKSWGLRNGDLVEVETLEANHKTFTVPVSGFSDEFIGLGANMRIETLWKNLDEATGYNFLTLKADPRKLDELYVELKGRPEIAAVNLKQALYQGFQSSFGRIIRVSTMTVMIASLFIALGIIYNSVRVSFSERSWELASLRVLGFGRLALTRILLLEIGTQVALSLLPGCLFGWVLTHLSVRLIHTETVAFPVIIGPATYARGLLAVLSAFTGSAWIVHRMIGQLNPAEALKVRE